MKEVVIVSAVRTPIGRFQGGLSTLSAPHLGSFAIDEALKRANVSAEDVCEVIMGEVISAGVGQAPARQASILAGIPSSVPCMTVNKVCGSGLKAVMLARQSIALGESEVVVAGGMESMSNAPYLLPGARDGYRMGPSTVVDSMIHDGLWDPYGNKHMGSLGDLCASENDFSREQQDEFAKQSYENAIKANEAGKFKSEIKSITIANRKGETMIDSDEEIAFYMPDKVSGLRPAFDKEGTVTAANASKISDGAAALVLMSKERAEKSGATILATIKSDATFAQDPDWFTTAPPKAIQKALDRAEMQAADVDLYEINEAFAVVALAAMKELNLDRNKVNVHGGAISLGHPIGCSGARILVTLLHAMKDRQARTGCASLCIGGGEAVALIVEMS